MKKLNLMKVKANELLNRDEMKQVIAGSGGSDHGNIYCMAEMPSGENRQVECNRNSLYECTLECINFFQDHCAGCAQFPGSF